MESTVLNSRCLATILSGFENEQHRNAGKNPICYNSDTMFELLRLWFGALFRIFHARRSLMLKNLALRQQLAVLKRRHPKPRLDPFDKLFWVVARRFWSKWKDALLLVSPETVVPWHRAGFRLYWAMLCKVRKCAEPTRARRIRQFSDIR
jgi:hypothetical protein